jgi:ribosome-binding protein aMBF1 (putative translation factor)
MNASTTTRQEVLARLAEFDWSQNELARRIRKDGGLVSRVLRGQVTSSVVWKRIERVIEREQRRRDRKAEHSAA